MAEKQKRKLQGLKSLNARYIEQLQWKENILIQDCLKVLETYTIMQGLEGFLTNSTKNFFYETYHALINCGALSEAEILEKAQKNFKISTVYYKIVQ